MVYCAERLDFQGNHSPWILIFYAFFYLWGIFPFFRPTWIKCVFLFCIFVLSFSLESNGAGWGLNTHSRCNLLYYLWEGLLGRSFGNWVVYPIVIGVFFLVASLSFFLLYNLSPLFQAARAQPLQPDVRYMTLVAM